MDVSSECVWQYWVSAIMKIVRFPSEYVELKPTHPRVVMDALGIIEVRIGGSTNTGFPVARFFTGFIWKVAAG